MKAHALSAALFVVLTAVLALSQQFIVAPTRPSGAIAGAALSADFNNDGEPDLAFAEIFNGNQVLSILLGNGDGTFRRPINTSTMLHHAVYGFTTSVRGFAVFGFPR